MSTMGRPGATADDDLRPPGEFSPSLAAPAAVTSWRPPAAAGNSRTDVGGRRGYSLGKILGVMKLWLGIRS